MKCSKCKHWKSEQAEMEYDKHYGICTCYKWKFVINDNTDVCLLNRNARTEKYKGVSRFENQNKDIPCGRVEKSPYCFVTNENFGCVNYEEKKK